MDRSRSPKRQCAVCLDDLGESIITLIVVTYFTVSAPRHGFGEVRHAQYAALSPRPTLNPRTSTSSWPRCHPEWLPPLSQTPSMQPEDATQTQPSAAQPRPTVAPGTRQGSRRGPSGNIGRQNLSIRSSGNSACWCKSTAAGGARLGRGLQTSSGRGTIPRDIRTREPRQLKGDGLHDDRVVRQAVG